MELGNADRVFGGESSDVCRRAHLLPPIHRGLDLLRKSYCGAHSETAIVEFPNKLGVVSHGAFTVGRTVAALRPVTEELHHCHVPTEPRSCCGWTSSAISARDLKLRPASNYESPASVETSRRQVATQFSIDALLCDYVDVKHTDRVTTISAVPSYPLRYDKFMNDSNRCTGTIRAINASHLTVYYIDVALMYRS